MAACDRKGKKDKERGTFGEDKGKGYPRVQREKRVKFNTTIIFTSKRLQILCRIFRDLDFLVSL